MQDSSSEQLASKTDAVEGGTVAETVRSRLPIIAPSMLKCDFSALGDEVTALERAGDTYLHWDVMDGQFVPNLSYGEMVFAPLRSDTQPGRLFEAHLMIADPVRYLDRYLPLCDSVIVHIETLSDPSVALGQIRDAGVLAGLAINPGTPVDAVKPWLGQADQVLVMSVEPGFGGQTFMPEMLSKVKTLRDWLADDQLIGIDGGIGPETIGEAAAAGCDLFVVGSAIFGTEDYAGAIGSLRETVLSRRSR